MERLQRPTTGSPLGVVVALNALLIMALLALAVAAKFGDNNQGRIILELFNEPFSRARPYEGVFTTLSEVLWCIPAAVCWFARGLFKHAASESARFLGASALLLTMFLADDLLRISLMSAFYLSIPKIVPAIVYGMSVSVYAYRFRAFFKKTPYVLALSAISLFAISAVVDIADIPGQGLPVMLEDGSKLIGLLNLAIYFWVICSHTLLTLRDVPQKL